MRTCPEKVGNINGLKSQKKKILNKTFESTIRKVMKLSLRLYLTNFLLYTVADGSQKMEKEYNR
jgi:hypothetical protein